MTTETERKATECYLALADDGLTDLDRMVWVEWLRQRPEHQKAYENADNIWHQLDNVGPVDLPTPEELETDGYDGEAELSLPQSPIRKNIAKFVRGGKMARPVPHMGKAVLGGIAASLVLALAVGFFFGFRDHFFHYQRNFQTRTGQIAAFDLPDGSRVTLAGHSTVKIDFSSKRRDLQLLRGRAYFDVAKDKARPFVVHSGMGSTTAIGTRFDVNNMNDLTIVTVSHGLVRVTENASRDAEAVSPYKQITDKGAFRSTLATVGEQVSYTVEGKIGPVREVNLDHILSWRRGYLTFIDEPLIQALDQVNRYSPRRIYYRPDDIKGLKVSGTVYLNNTADWLAGLERGYPVKVVDAGQENIFLTRKDL